MAPPRTTSRDAQWIVPHRFLTYAECRALGMTRRELRGALASGVLRRIRRDRYVWDGTPETEERALGAGGRLDCVSLLHDLGVFVQTDDTLHVQIESGASRLSRADSLVRRHWRSSAAPRGDLCADPVEAIAQAIRCQQPRFAVATLDSAWHLGVVDAELSEVFALLPARYAVLRPHLDRRAESGPESIARILFRRRGFDVEVQRVIPGVGRVDLVVDGWLIVECDSRAHHSGVAQQVADRRRDLEAAAQGYATLRILAEDILYRPERVLRAVDGLVAARAPQLAPSSSALSADTTPRIPAPGGAPRPRRSLRGGHNSSNPSPDPGLRGRERLATTDSRSRVRRARRKTAPGGQSAVRRWGGRRSRGGGARPR